MTVHRAQTLSEGSLLTAESHEVKPDSAVMERIRGGAAGNLVALRLGSVCRLSSVAKLHMSQMRIVLLVIQAGAVGLGAAEHLFLLLHRHLVPAGEVVHPALRQDEAAACARRTFGHEGDFGLILWFGVACAVNETGHVQRLAVDESRRLAGDRHVAR